MNRFAFASSIVLATFAVAACGDDTATSGTGGAGGASSTSDAASSGTPASSNASTSGNASSSGTPASSSSDSSSSGPPDVSASGTGGDGGAPGVGGSGAGGDPGVGGGGTGECAPACEAQDFALADQACQDCAIASAQGACGAEVQGCLVAGEGPDDVEGCTTCGDIVQGGDLETLCESNQDEVAAILACVCGVCG